MAPELKVTPTTTGSPTVTTLAAPAPAPAVGSDARIIASAARLEGSQAPAVALTTTDGAAGEKPGEKVEAVKANEDHLPDNEWADAYYDLKNKIKAGTTEEGPFTTFSLACYWLAAKYGNVMDLMPNRFRDRIWSSEELKGNTLSDEQAMKVLAASKAADQAKAEEDAEKAHVEAMQKDGRRLGKERASTRFATHLLGIGGNGVDSIDDAATLASSLLHTKRVLDGKNEHLYGFVEKKLSNLKGSQIAKGTLIVFVQNMNMDAGEKVVAVATGKSDEFIYYNVGKDDSEKDKTGIKRFHLKDADSPVTQLGLLAVLGPNFEKFEKGTPGAEKPAEEAKEERELTQGQKMEGALKEIEAGNKYVEAGIKAYRETAAAAAEKNTDHKPYLEKVQKSTRDNLEAAQKTYKELEPTADQYDVTALKAIRDAAAKAKTDGGATDEEIQALVKAEADLAEAVKVQEAWERIKALLEAAKENNAAAIELGEAEAVPATGTGI